MAEPSTNDGWQRQALALIDPRRGLWRMLPSPLIAAVHFTVCYMATSVYCIRSGRGELTTLNVLLGGFTVVALLAIGLLAWAAWRRLHLVRQSREGLAKRRGEIEFLARITWYLALLSFVGVLFIAAPLAFFGGCR
ncbi:MAG TPA: hypothetical protein VF210_21880 [Pseudomonadales bacterium]